MELCSVFDNIASQSGGGVWINRTADLFLGSSSVCDNSPEDIVGPWTDLGQNDQCGVPACLGDLNSDRVVNSTDLGLVLALWDSNNPLADLNGDGTVNASDLGLLLGSWGLCS